MRSWCVRPPFHLKPDMWQTSLRRVRSSSARVTPPRAAPWPGNGYWSSRASRWTRSGRFIASAYDLRHESWAQPPHVLRYDVFAYAARPAPSQNSWKNVEFGRAIRHPKFATRSRSKFEGSRPSTASWRQR